ncbi:MAG: hypothetical protein J1F02_12345 [Lachnospiraceae bacterium]|nr:hypothetical protein [Lachnospiraceae bacterium]
MKKMWIILFVVAVMAVSMPSTASEAAISKKVVKMLKGRWYRNSSSYDGQYAIFTSKYGKYYKPSGKLDHKVKLVSAKKKKSGYQKGGYVIRVKDGKLKYRLFTHMKNGKVKYLELSEGWTGKFGDNYRAGASFSREPLPTFTYQ